MSHGNAALVAASGKFAVMHEGQATPWTGLHGATSFGAFCYVALQALGVIFGDIGTSPLYVMSSIFPTAPDKVEDFLGGCSLVLWTIIILVRHNGASS